MWTTWVEHDEVVISVEREKFECVAFETSFFSGCIITIRPIDLMIQGAPRCCLLDDSQGLAWRP